MTPARYFFILLVAVALCAISRAAPAEDRYVKRAMSLTARNFDKTLPDQPVDSWLRSNLPARYQVVWGDYITDCGEGAGTAADKERDMPLCAEVEIKEGPEVKGYLALFLGTEKQGLLKDGCGLYFGYLEYHGKKFNFRQLRDILNLK